MSLYLPSGRGIVEKKCPNRECPEHDIVRDLPAFEEYGRLFLYRDDELYCRECGEEMIDP